MASRYWVGGTSTWDGTAASKWALTSGGSGGQAIPTSSDDVFFDANSGVNVITINATVNCKSLNCTGFAGTLASSAGQLNIFGDLTLGSGMAFTSTVDTIIQAVSTVTSNNVTIQSGVQFTGFTGTVTLGDSITVIGAGGIFIDSNVTFSTNPYNVTSTLVTTNGSTNATLNLGAGTWSLTATGTVWNTSSTTGLTINGGTSTIKFTNTTNGASTFQGGGKTYGNIWYSRGASTGSNTITGSNTFIDFKDTGTAAHSILFTAASNTTFTTWNVTGTAGNVITLNSSTTATFTLTCVSGIVSSDYLNIQHSVATGGASFYAGRNSINNQAVATAGSGWVFASYFSSTIIDTVIDTDSVTANYIVTIIDTVTDTDLVTAIKSRNWTNDTKNTSIWINDTKN